MGAPSIGTSHADTCAGRGLSVGRQSQWCFPFLKQGAYYTQPVYAAQPHVIHHTTVVQPNSIPSAIYPAPVAAPRTNGVAMGMVAGTTMAMSAGKRLLRGPTDPEQWVHLLDGMNPSSPHRTKSLNVHLRLIPLTAVGLQRSSSICCALEGHAFALCSTNKATAKLARLQPQLHFYPRALC